MAVSQGEEEKSGPVSASSAAASRLAARRAAKAATKASKRGTAPVVPTKVTQGVTAAKSWFDTHQRTMLYAALGAVALVVAWVLVGSQFGKRSRDAADLLGVGLTTANAPIIAPGSEPVGDAPEESYPTAQARAEKTRGAFETATKRFPDAPAAAWAMLGQANALNELGKASEAQAIYARVLEQKDLAPFVRWRALEGIAYAFEAQKKYDEALKRFAEIGELENGTYKVVADYQQARMQIALGQKQKAADLLQALIKADKARPAGEGTRFESVVSDAETLLTELSVELNAPKLRADIPSGAGKAPSGASPQATGTGLTKEIIESLRKQLESGKGGKGLTKDIVDQLDKQVKDGTSGGTSTTYKVPVQKAAPGQTAEKPAPGKGSKAPAAGSEP
jgi:hypothetical protein